MVAMAESDEFSAVVLDSVAALVPTAELNGEVGDSTIGLVARFMNQTLRKITGPASKTETTIFFINQLRDRVGVMYGSPETTTGGKGLKFYASIRLDVRRQIDRDKPTDNVKVKVVKNKVAPPFGLAEFKVRYGVGIDRVNEILNECVLAGIIQKSGSWFSYGDTKLGQGEDSVSDLLRDNPELFEELKANLTSD
jgi:recombination protein RecA